MVFTKLNKICGKDEKGSALVEAAVTLPVFLMIAFTGMDTLRVCYHAISAQYALNRASRTVVARTNPSEFMVREAVEDASTKFGKKIALDSTDLIICNESDADCTSSTDPDDWVVIKYNFKADLFFSAINFDFWIRSIGRIDN